MSLFVSLLTHCGGLGRQPLMLPQRSSHTTQTGMWGWLELLSKWSLNAQPVVGWFWWGQSCADRMHWSGSQSALGSVCHLSSGMVNTWSQNSSSKPRYIRHWVMGIIFFSATGMPIWCMMVINLPVKACVSAVLVPSRWKSSKQCDMWHLLVSLQMIHSSNVATFSNMSQLDAAAKGREVMT